MGRKEGTLDAMSKKPVGRPPKFKTAERIQTKIDAYFESCKGEPLMVDGEPYLDKSGSPVLVSTLTRPPSPALLWPWAFTAGRAF